MRAMTIALAMLLGALSATPAAAQDAAALQWLMGKWCASSTQQGKVCLTFVPKDDGAIAALWASQSSDVAIPEHSEATIRFVDGRATLENEDQGVIFREASHGPNELVFGLTRATVGGDAIQTIRYHRVGNTLVLEMHLGNGKTEAVAYKRED